MGEMSERVRGFLSALEEDPERAAEYLTEGFTFTGAIPEPLSKDAFLSFARVMRRAFPDWRYNAGDVVEERDSARAKVRMTGTHSGELVLPYADPLAPTGQRVELPEETLEFTFEGGRISRIRLGELADGGAPDLVSRLVASRR
jgi:predicted ester cyclase